MKLVSDVPRAFFEAPATRRTAVTLPEEALSEWEFGTGMVVVPRMSLYGTMDAARSCQREVAKLMIALGFVQSKYNASLNYRSRRRTLDGVAAGDMVKGEKSNKQWEKSVLVHGCDFVATDGRREINERDHWLEDLRWKTRS